MKIKDQFSKRERTEKGTNLTKVSRDGFPWGSRLDKSPNSLQSVQLFRIVYPPTSIVKYQTQNTKGDVSQTEKRKYK